MAVLVSDIDIEESILRQTGDLLSILLLDRTTRKNILWATDSYEQFGKQFSSQNRIKPDLVIGKYGKIIQPRAAKGSLEQRQRTKDKAEVFTPLKTVDQINKKVDLLNKKRMPNKNNWQKYIQELKLEITCGEAPFIVSRYNPTAHTGKLIKLGNRVGFLDRKLKIVSKYCLKKDEWLFWAKEAFKASYGYEWQGDNVLLARENLLYTLIDYYQDKFGQRPTVKVQEEFAKIVSWNIFQMDGLRYVTPMSCHTDISTAQSRLAIFADMPKESLLEMCHGCEHDLLFKHNGIYVKIMDWSKNEVKKFIDLI